VRGRDEEYMDDDDNKIIKKTTPEGQLFAKVTEGRIKTLRMEDRDFATRFVAFYLTNYNDYTPDMDSFMSKGMKKIYSLTKEQIETLKSDYRKALNTAYEIFGNDAFRKRFNLNEPRRPINKALFDSLSTSFAKLPDEKCKILVAKRVLFRDKLVALHNSSDGKFIRALTQGTALKTNVIQRFSDIENIIKETFQ
jgi:hypothetical protein